MWRRRMRRTTALRIWELGLVRYDSDFVIHCKPNGLCEIVGALKGAQEEDVKAVGFGGMLRIEKRHIL
ncbi:hypothetical protein CASFOL_027508 [Castilleja foliolosa]|uniref:Uncharacterized protein n=1 Tax=Castilleja foliolosa TaxID=1961234 RepID=A0ABD3CG26_9LAMI